MNRRPPFTDAPREVFLRVRVTPLEAEEARIAARAQDRTLSDLIRLLLRDNIRGVRKKHPQLFARESNGR